MENSSLTRIASCHRSNKEGDYIFDKPGCGLRVFATGGLATVAGNLLLLRLDSGPRGNHRNGPKDQ